MDVECVDRHWIMMAEKVLTAVLIFAFAMPAYFYTNNMQLSAVVGALVTIVANFVYWGIIRGKSVVGVYFAKQ